MSYILEALKKAQAERQLGAAPTLHAATLAGTAAAQRGGAWKKPLLIAVPVMGAAIVVLLGLLWKQSQTPPDGAAAAGLPATAAAQSGAQPASQPASQPIPQPQPQLGPQAAPPSALPASPPNTAQLPPPGPALPPQGVPLHPAPRHEKAAAAAPPRAIANIAPAQDGARPSAEAPSAAKPPAGDEPVLQTLRDLPEPIQRAIPAITMGGYIYSRNSADRLLLIDKVLRHEGEELAPGFVLEKLLPKEAVFNYKGYRYRVPY